VTTLHSSYYKANNYHQNKKVPSFYICYNFLLPDVSLSLIHLIQIVYNQYKVDEAYHYDNNLLLSITKVFKDVPKTLLKEHYRCNPKIIGFCNKKFYNTQNSHP
jgi:superfamily I DNA and/or RNA helicase